MKKQTGTVLELAKKIKPGDEFKYAYGDSRVATRVEVRDGPFCQYAFLTDAVGYQFRGDAEITLTGKRWTKLMEVGCNTVWTDGEWLVSQDLGKRKLLPVFRKLAKAAGYELSE